MLIVRPSQKNDLKHIIALAQKAGPGFTSLAVGRDVLKARLDKSVKSFNGPSSMSPDHVYILMLEDSDTGAVVGMSAVKAEIGIRDPFFNFRILKIAQKSNVTNSRYDMEVLVLVNEYSGASEVGSLFVTRDMRGPDAPQKGAGRLISQARYMIMAADKARFSGRIISELRGVVDDQGHAPFWEAIGRKFFRMDFMEADHISAGQDNQFILDLMPKYPIYAALLPEEAQAVMGQTHPAGVGAKRYLEAEGFRYDGVIDIFDGGPSMSAPRDDIRTIRDSRLMPVRGGLAYDGGEDYHMALISNDRIEDFRCVYQPMTFFGDTAFISQEALKALKLEDGNSARLWVKR